MYMVRDYTDMVRDYTDRVGVLVVRDVISKDCYFCDTDMGW